MGFRTQMRVLNCNITIGLLTSMGLTVLFIQERWCHTMADTPARYIRISDALWDKAVERSKNQGTNVSAIIRTSLERYVATDDDLSVNEILDRIMADLGDLQRRLHVKTKH